MMYCCISYPGRLLRYGRIRIRASILGNCRRPPGRLVARKLSPPYCRVKGWSIFVTYRMICERVNCAARPGCIDTFPLFAYDSYCNHKCDAPNPSVRAEGPGKMEWGESPPLAG
jgi:hypothetical protein